MNGLRLEPKPFCPDCGALMALRKPSPSQSWSPFWGCSQFPGCKGKRGIDASGRPEDDTRTGFTPADFERW